jgi:transketolase
MDAVQKANSGHPGAPMGMADIAEVLWNDFMRHNPANPKWANRDRFVMSNGHGSMLVYSLLHLTGYSLPIEELKNFRQLHSITPGHPEYGYAPGVETTTGPLGQGLGNAVGMAIAERTLAAQFNRPGHAIVDHHTYAFLGDGCLMEGISHEVCSLAGTLGLGKLICFYDDNGISIDGEVEQWFTDDTPARFKAYNWHVVAAVDGHDPQQIVAAIEQARAETGRPSLICCKTIIGKGAPNKQGKEVSHGSPLGVDEVALARKTLGWTYPPFEIPEQYYAQWDATEAGQRAENEWQQLFVNYQADHPELAAEFQRRVAGQLPADFGVAADAYIAECQQQGDSIASRKASQNCLNSFGPLLPELLGGSADLAGSNLTLWQGANGISCDDASGNYIYYGVREFGMTAIINGIALHGGFVAYGGTFLIFMEYARNALRMAALMGQRNIQVYTHDSIGLGEDGPTHQPVEQIASLRATPNLSTWRPCDTVETAVAWRAALERQDGPTALVLSRQNLPHQARSDDQVAAIARGGYTLVDCDGTPEAIIIATGSELGIAVDAQAELAQQGHKVRVVSMPCVDRFEAQDIAWRESVLPASVRLRVAVEAGVTSPWYKYVGFDGVVLGLDRFGESAPGPQLMEHFGFTSMAIRQAVEGLLQQ